MTGHALLRRPGTAQVEHLVKRPPAVIASSAADAGWVSRSAAPDTGHPDLPAAGLALLALVLGAALVVVVVTADDDSATGNAPDEVRQVLDDFATAFAEQAVDLMESIITDDFSGTVDFNNPGTVEPAFTVGVTPTLLLREVRESTFGVERSGDLLVAGEGPWTIAARETWSDPYNREQGTRIYVIVDEDGVPKIATYYFVAVKVAVLPRLRGLIPLGRHRRRAHPPWRFDRLRSREAVSEGLVTGLPVAGPSEPRGWNSKGP